MELEGGYDLIVLGGVATHAKPQAKNKNTTAMATEASFKKIKSALPRTWRLRRNITKRTKFGNELESIGILSDDTATCPGVFI
jgi:hypothetical protein